MVKLTRFLSLTITNCLEQNRKIKGIFICLMVPFSFSLHALEGTFINPDGLEIILEFKKKRVKVMMNSFRVPVWYKYTQEDDSIFIEDPKTGTIEFKIKGDTLTTEAFMLSGTYYRRGSKKLAQALGKNKARNLYEGAHEGNIEKIKDALEAKLDINAVDAKGETALTYAIAASQLDATEFLLNSGASVKLKYANEATILHFASALGLSNIVQLLIKHGSDPNSRMNDGQTPLMLVAAGKVFSDDKKSLKEAENSEGHVETVRLLLKAKANLNAKSNSGLTALMIAASGGKSEIARELLSSGAEVNAKSNDGSTALMLAAENGETELIDELLKSGAEIDAQDKDGNTALIRAVLNKNAEVLEKLLISGANPNVVSTDGGTALRYASANGNTDLVGILVKSGADVNFIEKDGWTALKSAKKHNHADIVKLLKEAGAKQ